MIYPIDSVNSFHCELNMNFSSPKARKGTREQSGRKTYVRKLCRYGTTEFYFARRVANVNGDKSFMVGFKFSTLQ